MRALEVGRWSGRHTTVLGRLCRRALPAGAFWVLVAGGCAHDATAPLTAADVVGTYALASIGGRPLPVPFGDPYFAASAVITFRSDSTYTEEDTYQYADGSHRYTQTFNGTWSLDASAAQLHTSHPVPGEPPATATFAVRDRGRTLVFVISSGDFVYKKQ